MSDVIDINSRRSVSAPRPFPAPAPTLARVAFLQSPRGRFEEHVNRLISLGHVGVGHAVLITYRDFAQDGARIEPGAVGEIHRLLLMVDQTDALAVRHARLAATSLLAMTYPVSDPEPTQPGAA